jgi:MerR family transcriptional regulator, light-induced transcriptional regulator
MASVYGIVRSIAKAGSPGPMLRSIVGRKPVARPPAFDTLVEREIIPRLVIAHSADDLIEVPAIVQDSHITAEEAAAFAPLAIDHGACALLDHVEKFLDRGVSVDTIFVDLLAPSARQLGVMWEEDDADFVAVTMALWRLQEVVRELSARVPVRGSGGDAQMRALFSVMPGEQHSFGTVMVEDVFRRAGWATELMTECDTSQLLALVAANEFDLIGLTVTGDRHCETVPSVINCLRSVSRNPHVAIMVGGRVFNDEPDLATQLGADATAHDATQALEVARSLVEGLVARSEFCA